MRAENGIGKLVSRKLAAQGRLSANMKIAENGRAVIKLLDASGNAIPGYEKSFTSQDGVDIPVFDELPAGAFKVDIELENAEIYALNFEK